jgi:3-oxoacyl-(acyl-carrier-protein) synthase
VPILSHISRSLVVFLVLVVSVGAAIGHVWTALGIAAFAFALASIEGKPSWRRIFDPDPRGEGGVWRFVTWKRLVARPNDRDPTVRP